MKHWKCHFFIKCFNTFWAFVSDVASCSRSVDSFAGLLRFLCVCQGPHVERIRLRRYIVSTHFLQEEGETFIICPSSTNVKSLSANVFRCWSCRQATPRWAGLWATCWVWAICSQQREWCWGRPWPREHGEVSSFSLSFSSLQSSSSSCSELGMERRKEAVKAPSRYCSNIQCSQYSLIQLYMCICFGFALQYSGSLAHLLKYCTVFSFSSTSYKLSTFQKTN